MASRRGDAGRYGVTKLNGTDNYVHWSGKMQRILQGEKLWKYIEEDAPTEPDEVWTDGNLFTISQLIQTMEDSQDIHHRGLQTAKEIWDALKAVYGRTSTGGLIALLKRFFTASYDGGPMKNHLESIMEAKYKPEEASVKIEDYLVVAVMLYSLPASFDNLNTVLDQSDIKLLSIQEVTNKIIDHHAKVIVQDSGSGAALRVGRPWPAGGIRSGGGGSRNGSEGKGGTKNGTFNARPGGNYLKETRACHYCHNMGHLKKDCFKRKRDLEAKSAGNNGINKHSVMRADGNTRHLALTAVARAASETSGGPPGSWVIDSGATAHMCRDRDAFINLVPEKTGVRLAGDVSLPVLGRGTARVKLKLPCGNVGEFTLKDTFYMPSLVDNLFSTGKAQDAGLWVIHTPTGQCRMTLGTVDGQLMATGQKVSGVTWLDVMQEVESQHKTEGDARFVSAKRANSVPVSMDLWHRRFGHRDPDALVKLFKEELVTGVHPPTKERSMKGTCEVCISQKLTRAHFPSSNKRAAQPLDLIHTDLCGPIKPATPSGRQYILTIIDDHSRYTEVKLLTLKSEVTDAILDYIAATENQFNRKVKKIRSDNGREYVNSCLRTALLRQGIKHQFTVPHTPEQNGVAERKNRSLVEMVRCMLKDSGLALKYWGEAVTTANFMQNRLPSKAVEKTPFEHWFGNKPDVSYIRTFGSKVYAHIPKCQRSKLEGTAEEGILVGYGPDCKGYRVLNVANATVRVAVAVRILESDGTPNGVEVGVEQQEIELKIPQTHPITGHEEPTPQEEEADVEKVLKEDEESSESESEGEEERVPLVPTTFPPRRVSERTTKGVPPLRYREDVPRCSLARDPESWEEMQSLPRAERHNWEEAAREEIKSLDKHKVWDLVRLPPGKKTISAKWVFRTKRDGDGNVASHKARLVARGFSQRPGVDYEETYAPVVRYDTVRMLLGIAAMRKLHVRQLDVKSAYLHGELEEELFMDQPEGFEASEKKANLVCRLKKSLYGLKQSARAWNKRADDVLSMLGFHKSRVDNCLYFRSEKGNTQSYVLIYVDDMLVVSSTGATTKEIGVKLACHFDIKDLGEVRHYLGVQITRNAAGDFLLNQREKVERLLEEHGMLNCHAVRTPMETGFLADESKSPMLPNNTAYRQAIGSLLHLATVSRPDIANAIGLLCRRVQNPTERDWKAVKRVLRYLSGTKDKQLRLAAAGEEELVVYVDADWAGDHLDRKSTSGHLFKLGKSSMSWSSRKQSAVTLSSTEAEYAAASDACRELVTTGELLNELGVEISSPIRMMEDNQGCLKLVTSERYGSRTKHFAIYYHNVRDLHEKKLFQMEYCPSEAMLADVLTKPLPGEQHENMCKGLGLTSE